MQTFLGLAALMVVAGVARGVVAPVAARPCSPLTFAVDKILESDSLQWLLFDLPVRPVGPCQAVAATTAPTSDAGKMLIRYLLSDPGRTVSDIRSFGAWFANKGAGRIKAGLQAAFDRIAGWQILSDHAEPPEF